MFFGGRFFGAMYWGPRYWGTQAEAVATTFAGTSLQVLSVASVGLSVTTPPASSGLSVSNVSSTGLQFQDVASV